MVNDDGKTHRLITIVIGVVAVVFISWIGICNYGGLSQAEVMLQLSQQHNLHPAVVDCMLNRNWNVVSDFEMCRKIFESANLSMERVENIKGGLND
jgi:hypothetical protein